MSSDRDTARIVRSWLEEGRTTLPDWIRDDVFDRLPATPQRRSRGTAWRFLTMPTAAKTAIAAAAVILVAVGAFALLPRESGPAATSPSPTTAPTTTPTAEPSAVIRFVPQLGRIDPGTYRMGEDASIVLTIPEGWDAQAGFDNYPTGTEIRKHRDQPGELSLRVDATDSIAVYPSVCGPDADAVSDAVRVGPTVDDLVTAIRAQEGSEISEPVDVAIGGRDVQRFEISIGQGVDPADCEDGVISVLYSKAFGFISSRFTGEPQTRTVYMVQTDAGRIVFQFGHGLEHNGQVDPADEASDADIAELDAIVESMVIEP